MTDEILCPDDIHSDAVPLWVCMDCGERFHDREERIENGEGFLVYICPECGSEELTHDDGGRDSDD